MRLQPIERYRSDSIFGCKSERWNALVVDICNSSDYITRMHVKKYPFVFSLSSDNLCTKQKSIFKSISLINQSQADSE